MSTGTTTNYFVHPLLRAHNWQNRPQLDEVCKWWRDGGRGVCALVGMGGAGKSAVAERFMRILPNGLPADPSIPKDPSLPTPRSVFVFSFYDAPNAEAFFHALQMWLQNTADVQTVWTTKQFIFQLQRTHALIVLDGLERVQEDGLRGEFGRVTSPKLREVLNQLAAGNVQDVSVLTTSRFHLSDLRDRREGFYCLIPVDKIDLAAGIALLRDRGVTGSDIQLLPIVEHCGRHALTVDFAGGYIAEYGNGDSTTPLHLGTVEEFTAAENEELDEERRNILHQGFRFARIAGYYRDAMIRTDQAAMALLERICLFRLGAEIDTLTVIFTGIDAVNVSGEALAGLDRQTLQRKLDWLVRMRIVESSDSSVSVPVNSRRKTFYTIHPAVRDGFLSGITRETAVAGHEAVRRALAVSLGGSHDERPSDDATLDLLEEIVHHTVSAGHIEDAWSIYFDRIGGRINLLIGLHQIERGIRLTKQLYNAAGQTAGSRHGSVRFNAGLHYLEYLTYSGQVSAATRLVDQVEVDLRGHFLVICKRRRAEIHQIEGALKAAKEAAHQSISVAREVRTSSHTDSLMLGFSYEAFAVALLGDVTMAMRLFRSALEEQRRFRGMPNNLLIGLRGVWRADLLFRLGRHSAADRELQANYEHQVKRRGSRCFDLPRIRLKQVPIRFERSDIKSATMMLKDAENHEENAPSHEVACGIALESARIQICKCNIAASDGQLAHIHLSNGLKIARDCGFGLYHIDLLITRARLHLLEGNPDAALADIDVALEKGIPEDLKTGQPQLRAACDPECCYAWPVPEGLQLKGEALLLKAAQESQSQIYDSQKYFAKIDALLTILYQMDQELSHAITAKQSHGYSHATVESMVDGRGQIATNATQSLEQLDVTSAFSEVTSVMVRFLERSINGQNVVDRQPKFRQLVNDLQSVSDALHNRLVTSHKSSIVSIVGEAADLLNEAMDLWQPLHDPEPERENQNFKLNGKQYNYRATETNGVLNDLEAGVLTRYRLSALAAAVLVEHPTAPERTSSDLIMRNFDVFLSHNSTDKPNVRKLKKRLVDDHGLKVWLDEDELTPGVPWQPLLEKGIRDSKSVAVLVGNDGFGPWQDEETFGALELAVRERLPVIPVLLPNAPVTPDLPMFLANRGWVDFRKGFLQESLERLVWGITGVKPNPQRTCRRKRRRRMAGLNHRRRTSGGRSRSRSYRARGSTSWDGTTNLRYWMEHG